MNYQTNRENTHLRRAHALNLHRATLLGSLDRAVSINDPLAEFFRYDRVIDEVSSDGDALFWSYLKGMGLFSLVCPCFIPHQLILCTPCSIPSLHKQAHETADKVRLILRENTLVYQQTRSKVPSVQPGAMFVPVCQTCAVAEIPDVEILIPLAQGGDRRPEVSVELLNPSSNVCDGGYYPVETIVVKVDGETVFALDAPTKGAEFVEACNRQMQQARDNRNKVYQSVPVAVLDAHDATIRIWQDSIPMSQLVLMDALQSAKNTSSSNDHHHHRTRLVEMEIMRQIQVEFQNKYNEYCRVMRYLTEGQGRFIDGVYVPMAAVTADPVVATAAPLLTAEMVRETEPSVQSPLLNLSVEDVCSELTTLGLSKHHVEAFRQHRVDGPVLNFMDEDTLKELGIDSALERKKILAWVLRTRQSLNLAVA